MTVLRDSKYEYLKIVAMLMIISHHFVAKNAFNVDTDVSGLTINKIFLQFIGNHAFIGNNLFFMVSAWFLCAATPKVELTDSIRKIWKLDRHMIVYSILLAVGFLVFNNQIFKLIGGRKINYIFPLSTNLWWYPTSYAIFLLFYPFYQKLLISSDEREVKRLILLEVGLWCVPSVIPIEWSLGANGTTTFFMIYAIIYYVRKYNPTWASNPKKLGWLIIGGYTAAFASVIILDYIGIRIPIVAKYSCYFIRGNWRLLPMIISVGIFLWCTRINVQQSRFINAIGASTFAVYLIHMHPMMEYWLFKKVFNLHDVYSESIWELIVYTIAVILIIFVGGIVIDKTRISLGNIFIVKPYRLIQKILPKLRVESNQK